MNQRLRLFVSGSSFLISPIRVCLLRLSFSVSKNLKVFFDDVGGNVCNCSRDVLHGEEKEGNESKDKRDGEDPGRTRRDGVYPTMHGAAILSVCGYGDAHEDRQREQEDQVF